MFTITFTPDHIHRYQVSLDHLTPAATTMCFGFGRQGAMIIRTVSSVGEPNSFARFCVRWNSPALAGAGTDLWVGFMALRYILGYFSQWELLPTPIRYQAGRPTATTVTPPQLIAAAVRSWDIGWEYQLDPLADVARCLMPVRENSPPTLASGAGGPRVVRPKGAYIP